MVGAFESLDVGLSAAAQWLNNDDRLGKSWNTILQQATFVFGDVLAEARGCALDDGALSSARCAPMEGCKASIGL